MKSMLKKIIPKKVLNLRHLFYAWLGAIKYGHPSEELLVIGVTGTSGKSSVIHFLRQALEQVGFKVGSLSTVDFYVAGEEKLNDQKMTMLGKMQIQKYLREMVNKKCDIAIVEATSEGAVQHRHKFINYDMIVLTNLWPEHIESHGSYKNYVGAKLDIFRYVASCKRKKIKIKRLEDQKINKFAIVNEKVKERRRFLKFNFDKKIKFNPVDSVAGRDGLHFKYSGTEFTAQLFGKHNVENLLSVIEILRTFDIPWKKIQEVIKNIKPAPGRVEFIPEAEELGFQVIVDYAFEPKAMQALYEIVDLIKPKRVIHVFGSTGGGRDVERRFSVGKMVGEKADICIVTDEDPYDDDPMEIINDVAGAVEKTGKKLNKDLFKILDRGESIKKAVDLAKKGDFVLITGKGSEQAMCVAGGKMVAWDDREEVRKYLKQK